MDKVFVIVSFAAILIFAFAKLKYELHMMQLNSYRNNRYINWLKGNIFEAGRVLELLTFLGFMAALFYLDLWIACLIGASLYALLAYRLLARKQKKPVVFTPRAKRLFVATFLLVMIIGALAFLSNILLFRFLIIGFSLILSFLLIAIANKLVTPIENSINAWYYKDAKKILSQMPSLTIIGITGSYGKTSTKHFLHRVLSEKYNVLMTPGSYNTTMGVIKTIREQLQPVHQVFIVEMGAKQIGDIKEICDLVNPTIGVLTAVGEQHLESFKSIENVQKTKFELIDALPKDGLGVLNGDYEYIRNRQVLNTRPVYYSSSNVSTEYFLSNISYSAKGSQFTVFHANAPIMTLETRLLGSYNLSNILSAIIVAKHLQVPDSSISFAVKKLEPVQHRLEIKRNSNGITIVDDAFNSNPIGAQMAMEVLKNVEGGRKIVVTPGMIELGEKQEFYNRQFGEQMAVAADYVILVGKKTTEPILQGLKNKKYPTDHIYVAQNFKDATRHLGTMVKVNDVVLYENDLPDTYEK